MAKAKKKQIKRRIFIASKKERKVENGGKKKLVSSKKTNVIDLAESSKKTKSSKKTNDIDLAESSKKTNVVDLVDETQRIISMFDGDSDSNNPQFWEEELTEAAHMNHIPSPAPSTVKLS